MLLFLILAHGICEPIMYFFRAFLEIRPDLSFLRIEPTFWRCVFELCLFLVSVNAAKWLRD